MGRSWQCGTIQFDFNLANRFDVKYTNEEGDFEAPVIMHQAMYGSVERWIGILLESSQGDLPLWLHPQPVAIASVNESNCHFAKYVADRLIDTDIPVLSDFSKSSVGRKMKRFHKKKITFVITIGDHEVENGVVAIKNRKEGILETVPIEQLPDYISSRLK